MSQKISNFWNLFPSTASLVSSIPSICRYQGIQSAILIRVLHSFIMMALIVDQTLLHDSLRAHKILSLFALSILITRGNSKLLLVLCERTKIPVGNVCISPKEFRIERIRPLTFGIVHMSFSGFFFLFRMTQLSSTGLSHIFLGIRDMCTCV